VELAQIKLFVRSKIMHIEGMQFPSRTTPSSSAVFGVSVRVTLNVE
jgi:hypothetical protein